MSLTLTSTAEHVNVHSVSAMHTPSSSIQVEPAPAPAIELPTTIRRIVLAGFMGAGKTTVGRLLSVALGWEFVDTDAILETRTGNTIAQLFDQHGESGFRLLESSALAQTLGRRNAVVGLGGGIPEILTNRLLLEQTPGTVVIFLDAPFPVLFDRCILQENAAIRPVLQDPATAAHRFQQRHPIYRRIARHHIDTEHLTATDAVAAILQRLITL